MKVLLLSFLFVTACAQVSYSDVKPGQFVQVNQRLEIRPDTARVVIQGGKELPWSALNVKHPHCWFIAWEQSDLRRFIEPDTFTITAVRQTEYVVLKTLPALASNSATLFMVDGGAASDVEYRTEIDLHSDTQPGIRQLVCNHWEDPADASHLTWEQIQATLQPLAVLIRR